MPHPRRNKIIYQACAPLVCAIVFLSASAVQAATIKNLPNNTGLAGYWSFDEGKGVKAGDYSGNGHTATFSGGVGWGNGRHGQAAVFDGTSGYAQAASLSALQADNSRTVNLWFKTSSALQQPLFDSGGSSSNGQALQIFLVAQNGISGAPKTTAGAYVVFWDDDVYLPDLNLSDGKWHNLAVTLSGSSVYFYVDGALPQGYVWHDTWSGQLSQPFTLPLTPNTAGNPVQIGTTRAALWASGSSYFNGSIDDLRVYSRALSATEISALAQTGQVKATNQPAASNASQGLRGAYFTGMNFNTADLTRIDSTVNFNWGTGSPDARVPTDQFSARWTGYVKADYSETYTFYTTSDDGARLWVNGQQVINSWIDQAPTEHSGTIALTAGKWYPLTLEYYENAGGAVISLSYSSASVTKQIIPAGHLAYNLAGTSGNIKQNAKNTSGLAGYWSFNGPDTGTSTAADLSGNGNTLSFNGGVSKTAGKVAQGLSFNGSTGYLYQPSFPNVPSSQMTICAWLKTPGTAGRQYILSLSRSPSNFANEGVFQILASNKLEFWDYTSYSTFGFTDDGVGSNTSVTDNKWHYACFVKNGVAGTYYLDGHSDGTRTANVDIAYGNTDLVVGGDYRDSTSYFNGSLDEVRVYSRALSAAEISALYAAGK